MTVLGALLAACSGPSEGEGREQRWTRTSFHAIDGVRLDGRLYGGWRDAVVILAHMGRAGDSQADWHSTARALAREGYGALTYNRRGVCPGLGNGCSEGDDELASAWKDVVGAYRRVRAEGTRTVLFVGASIGAMSMLKAAIRADVDVAGLVEIGGINHASGHSFTRRDLGVLEGVKVFASSEGDIYGGAAAAREWYSWARSPKQLLVLDGDEHGTDILTAETAGSRRLLQAILRAVKAAG